MRKRTWLIVVGLLLSLGLVVWLVWGHRPWGPSASSSKGSGAKSGVVVAGGLMPSDRSDVLLRSPGSAAVAAATAPEARADRYLKVKLETPFKPAREHSVILAQAPESDRHTIYGRASDNPADAPLQLAGEDLLQTSPTQVLPTLLAVRTAAGAEVTFAATQLGTFANGHNSITVQADREGLARVQFRAGRSMGPYPVYAASPARTGLIQFVVQAEE